MRHSLLLLFMGLALFTAKADTSIFSDNFSSSFPLDNPWSCSDRQGLIKLPVGEQLLVSDSGNINSTPLGPSIAVGDLNGDGLPDLVVADSVGFFWFFANHGTKNSPKYTTAEIMPIWLGDPCPNYFDQANLVTKNVVPLIQLVDFDNDGKLDIVVGNYLGQLFYLRNQGSPQQPVFKTPENLDDITIATRRHGKLWCNYLSPCLYDRKHDGHLDLLMGDGSYSANSIYFLANKGTNDRPEFSEENTAKIIPGMGREHLAPQVISWNSDGKADILSVERSGFLNLFLYKGVDEQTDVPTYDEGRHISVGNLQKLVPGSSVTVANLSGEKLPGLVIGSPDGHLSYASNSGKDNAFQFTDPVTLKGFKPPSKILKTLNWTLDGGYGSPYDLLVCTNAQVEPGFTPPPDTAVTSALRFYVDEPATPNATFPNHFYPKADTRVIRASNWVSMKASKRYKLDFWVRADGNINNLKVGFGGQQDDPHTGLRLGWISKENDIDPSISWTHETINFEFESLSDDPTAPVSFGLSYSFNGNGSLYIAALSLVEKN